MDSVWSLGGIDHRQDLVHRAGMDESLLQGLPTTGLLLGLQTGVAFLVTMGRPLVSYWVCLWKV
jgi:hypothetical protein